MTHINPIRALQLDLARRMETLPFIKQTIDFAAEYHFNTLFLYLEWRIRTDTVDLGPGNAYSAEELRELGRYAAERGIQLIPGLAALAHAEQLLALPQFAEFSELRGGRKGRFPGTHSLCPSLPEVRTLLARYFTEVAAIFDTDYLHIGCDEAYDAGICPECKSRASDFAGEQQIYLDHLCFCHDIITGKLGKTMMIWDDMFECYPDILEYLPRDIVLVNWQYRENMTGYLGHFGDLCFHNALGRYKELGFSTLSAPADFRWGNIVSSALESAKYPVIGNLLTSWTKRSALIFKFYPLFAATGLLWHGDSDGETALEMAARELFGIKDHLFIAALRQYASSIERTPEIPMRALRCFPFSGPDGQALEATATMHLLLSRFAEKADNALGNTVLGDIIDDVALKLLALRTIQAAWRMRKKHGNPPIDEILSELETVSRSRIAACLRWRTPSAVADFRIVFDTWRDNLLALQREITEQGFLRLLFCLPNPYGVEELTIEFRCNNRYVEVATGTFKELSEAFFEYYLPIPRTAVPETVRISAHGFGGEGICYVEAETDAGHFVPYQIMQTSGLVDHPEYVLSNDLNSCFLGSQCCREAYREAEKASAMNILEIELLRKDF